MNLSTELNNKQKRQIQKITGKFLYNSRSVYSILLHALNELNMASSKATEQTQKDLEHFLNYCATKPEAQIIYRTSDMQLEIDCDAAYLVASKARKIAVGYHYLGNYDGKLFNRPIYVLAKVIKDVMSSAAEAESESLFLNAGESVQYITS